MPTINERKYAMSQNSSEKITQLTELQSKIKYDSFLFSINYIVEQFRENSFYIPKSKRTLVWNKRRQMRLIEMVILGLPIPFLATVFTGEYPYDEQYEVIDGSQKILTLEAFMSNRLRLENLEILTLLNGFTFSDIHFIQRNKFKSRIFKTVVVGKTVPRDMVREIAMRLNSSSGGTSLHCELA